ncbi:hypothetical protein C7212DRAFT_285632 [Tuber magnatum]|uniref:Uncharacterized protein n=1 Tax=Tuber magnatum TaxID=42249 RepID=A0A317SFX7_9PEZI|nr:hypothetical protein C7212DRAFT_285632 [Tuber magnatum]
MTRLRSMEASVTSPVTPKSALDRIAEASTKLNSNATPATTLDYPSLAKIEYPSLDKVQYPEIPLTTPRANSRIPTYAATTGKKLGNVSEKLKDEATATTTTTTTTPAKPAQKLKLPSTGFEFRVIKTGEKKVAELVPPVPPVTAAAVATPARPIAKKKSRRFSDVHRRQFEKMESITTHYAAKRTPKQPVTIEKMPRGVKRTKSRAELGDRGPPSSPSPVKMPVEGPRNAEGDGGSPMKRTKISAVSEEKTALPRKPSGIPRLGMTPIKGLTRRPATLAKIPMGGRLNLTPATRLASLVQTGATPSKIPSAVTTTPVAEDTGSAPSTAATPPSRHIKLPITDTPEKETKSLAPPETDSFTFRSDGAGMNYKRLSDMHSFNYNLNKGTPTAPAPLLTPMKVSAEDPFVGMARRAAMEWAPVAVAHAEKRKAPHSDDDNSDNGAGGGEVVDTVKEGGARKRLKFAPAEEPTTKATEAGEATTVTAGTPVKKKSLKSRGKAILLRSRLNMLAVPKRMVEKDTEGNGEKKDKDAGRIRWK